MHGRLIGSKEMETNATPRMRTDLDFLPIVHEHEQFILIRDPLGLVEEGKAVPLPLYDIMVHLNGRNTIRDIQMVLMKQKGGILVGSDEVARLLETLDASYLLDTERYRRACENIIAQFSAKTVRPCFHCGRSYPAGASELRTRLDEIMGTDPVEMMSEEKMTALIAPHIDLSAGSRIYAKAYRRLRKRFPSRVVILGVGHQMVKDLYSLTRKDFETPFGLVKNDIEGFESLRDAAKSILTENDFDHRAEHSIEFQILFLQYLFKDNPFTIIPILCGPLEAFGESFTRSDFLDIAGPFLKTLRDMINDRGRDTLLLAGVDFSHIGPKFGHQMPAFHLESQAESHDKNLLQAICQVNGDAFWEESQRVGNQFNVCGFSALACLMETLPPSEGQLLGYQIWHEEATRSAVSFAAVAFTKRSDK